MRISVRDAWPGSALSPSEVQVSQWPVLSKLNPGQLEGFPPPPDFTRLISSFLRPSASKARLVLHLFLLSRLNFWVSVGRARSCGVDGAGDWGEWAVLTTVSLGAEPRSRQAPPGVWGEGPL